MALAARDALPTFYQYREYVAAGGLISYGASRSANRVYTGGILKGQKPVDLPCSRPSSSWWPNLKNARTLGLAIPPGVFAIADEVIE